MNKKQLGYMLFAFASVCIAFVWRMTNLEVPPYEFHTMRQYLGANAARAKYYRLGGEASPAVKQAALATADREHHAEPPILPLACAYIYRCIGRESFAASKVITVSAWTLGAAAIWLLAMTVLDPIGALVALSVSLFLPITYPMSRTFQPDPIMLAGVFWSYVFLIKYWQEKQLKWFWMAAIISAVATFVKPHALFVLAPFNTFMAITDRQLSIKERFRLFLWFGIVTALPAMLYYLVGSSYVRSEDLRTSITHATQYGLWLRLYTWRGWIMRVVGIYGVPVLVFSACGILAIGRKESQKISGLLIASYCCFSLAFPFLVSTHAYYHIQLLPVVCLGLGGIGSLLWTQVAAGPHTVIRKVCMGFVFIVLLGWGVLTNPWTREPVGQVEYIESARAIGSELKHSDSTVVLDYDLGRPLFYFGEFSGYAWPQKPLLEIEEQVKGYRRITAAERFARDFAPLDVDFFVIRSFYEYSLQPDLQAFLNEKFNVVSSTADYIIYDLRSPKR